MGEVKRENLARDYTATMLWMIGKMLGRDGWTIDSYVEMAYPDTVTDKRTADDIKRDLIARLTV